MLAARRCGCCKRKLEGDGLETRTVTASVPARVDYQLTLLGEELVNRCKINAQHHRADQGLVRVSGFTDRTSPPIGMVTDLQFLHSPPRETRVPSVWRP